MPQLSDYITRKYTNVLLELVKDGLLDKDNVIQMCLNYMSEQEVQDMVEMNDLSELFK